MRPNAEQSVLLSRFYKNFVKSFVKRQIHFERNDTYFYIHFEPSLHKVKLVKRTSFGFMFHLSQFECTLEKQTKNYELQLTILFELFVQYLR